MHTPFGLMIVCLFGLVAVSSIPKSKAIIKCRIVLAEAKGGDWIRVQSQADEVALKKSLKALVEESETTASYRVECR